MIRYVIIPCRSWSAVIEAKLVSDDPDWTMRWASALCQDRVDARAIAKRLNEKQRKAFVIEKNKRARIAARNRSRR